MSSKKILFVIGTRPEAIKLSPLIIELNKGCQAGTHSFKSCICLTGQHEQLATEVLELFELTADHHCKVLSPNQSLASLSQKLLSALDEVIAKEKPDLVIVQGDTNSAMIGALAAFYNKVQVLHVEAGLRCNDKMHPYPEEMNRRLISQIADIHAAPTEGALQNLMIQGIKGHTLVTGNTGIDALRLRLEKQDAKKSFGGSSSYLIKDKFNVVVTMHRRENIGEPMIEVCEAINTLSIDHKELNFIILVHPNPEVKNIFEKHIAKLDQIQLIAPLAYDEMIQLMKDAQLMMTDSGGLQEESAFMGLPVIVLRDDTERYEGIKAGNAKLLGTAKARNIKVVKELLSNDSLLSEMSKKSIIYGDGFASGRIVKAISNFFDS